MCVLAVAFTVMLIHIRGGGQAAVRAGATSRHVAARGDARAGQLSDLPVPRAAPLARGIGNSALEACHRLAGHLVYSRERGNIHGIALGYLAERPIMNWRAAFLDRFRSPRTPPERGDVKVPVLSIQQ